MRQRTDVWVVVDEALRLGKRWVVWVGVQAGKPGAAVYHMHEGQSNVIGPSRGRTATSKTREDAEGRHRWICDTLIAEALECRDLCDPSEYKIP